MRTGPGNQWRTSHMHQRQLLNSTVTTQTRRTNTEGPKEKSHVLNYLKSVPIKPVHESTHGSPGSEPARSVFPQITRCG